MQSATSIQRDIFIKLSFVLELPKDILVRVNRTLYGLPEAELHWYETYREHYLNKLKISTATYDPCFIFTENPLGVSYKTDKQICGANCLQTEDTLNIETHTLSKRRKIIEPFQLQRCKSPVRKIRPLIQWCSAQSSRNENICPTKTPNFETKNSLKFRNW